MPQLHFNNIGIAALAGAVPDFIQKINLDPAHENSAYIKSFVKQTGILQRHISITEQTASDMAYAAMQLALAKAGWTASDLDGIVFLTQTPDFNNATGNSFVLHNHLKMREDALAFDIAQGCASFPYGLAVCSSLLQQPQINRLAMAIGDAMWPIYANKEELLAASSFLIGDGAAVMLLEKKENSSGSNSLDISLFSDGSGYHFLYCPADGIRHAWRSKQGLLPDGAVYPGRSYMDGMEITSFATMRVVNCMKEFCANAHKNIGDYNGIILHQANLQIIKTMAKRLKVPPENLPITVDRLANTNGASVLLTMIDAYAGREQILNLLISAFGIGLSWGIVDMKIDSSVIVPLIESSARFEEDFLKPLPENPAK